MKLENMRAIDYTADSNFRIFVSLGDGIDSTLPLGWAVGKAFQFDTVSTEYFSELTFNNDDAVAFITISQPRQYRSVTLILAPASWKREPFSSADWETSYGYFTNEMLAVLPNTPTVLFAPYPNPAVISQMAGGNLNFRFQIATDSAIMPITQKPFGVIDVYTIAGELIKTIEGVTAPLLIDPVSGTMRVELDWNMRSQSGQLASSGVYLCLMRLYTSIKRDELIAEDRAKVLIVR